MRAVELDERLGRSVLLGLGGVVVEGRGDLLGKLLAQLDAPLVVGVNAPDLSLIHILNDVLAMTFVGHQPGAFERRQVMSQ